MTVGNVFWPTQLSPAERRALEPGVPADLNRTPDILVVGGGIIGVATAVACVRAQLGSVLLLERATLASGASGGAAGQLLPEAHLGVDPLELVELGRLGLSGWRELEASTPGGVGVLDFDWLGIGPSIERFALTSPRKAERLSADDVARLIPGLRAPGAGMLIRGEGRLNPVRALARLAATLPSTASGIEVTGVVLSHQRISQVVTSQGTFEPGVVVFATGLPPRLDGLDLDLPAHEVKGHIVVSEPTPLRLPGAVEPLASTIDDGRLLIGGSLDIGDTERVVRPAILDGEWSELVHDWPAAGAYHVEFGWACFRPAHPDRLPVIDRLPELDNAWLSSGHYKTGILMAPATGNALARWIGSGKAPAEVQPFAARRLLAPTFQEGVR